MLKIQKTRDWLLVILVNFIWATQVPVIRLIGNKLGPMTIAFVPMLISTLLFIPFLWAENKKRKGSGRRTWKDLRYFILPGLIGIFLMQYLYTLGSTLTLASNAGIITLTIPVLVAIFAAVLLKEKFNIVRVIGFIIAIAGVLLTSLPDIKGASFSESIYFKGNLIFLLACSCAAFFNTYSKMLVDKKFTELEILVYSSLVGSIACIPLLIWVEPFSFSEIIHSGRIAFLGLLELSLMVYGVSMLLFFHILKRMDVSQAILGNYLLPFFISLLGIILLNEKITASMLMGGIIIFAGTLMVTVYEKQLLSLFNRRGKNGLIEAEEVQKMS
ncbi:DMT family transporter [Agriterribacter sp.]|uniref:DMT family transporter n=1 Tax=Agriterribacter sp. TaxID=2821509 RepID=UPI002B52168A|nr:DMT family transporter [Agriterribacter sp.]HTN07351.1 DMT family transporter [Agriterribacter sp.]